MARRLSRGISRRRGIRRSRKVLKFTKRMTNKTEYNDIDKLYFIETFDRSTYMTKIRTFTPIMLVDKDSDFVLSGQLLSEST